MTGEKEAGADNRRIASSGEVREPQVPDDANDSMSTRSTGEKGKIARLREHEVAIGFWKIVSWTPKRCRWDPESPPKFGLALNILFGFVSLHFTAFHHGRC